MIIEGRPWVPHLEPGYGVPFTHGIKAGFYGPNNKRVFFISARREPSIFSGATNSYDQLFIAVAEPKKNMEFIVHTTSSNYQPYADTSYINFYVSTNASFEEYSTGFTSKGKVFFTNVDLINRVMSGRFEFQATNQTTGEKIRAWDGRFDVIIH